MTVKTATECLITLQGVSKAYQQPNGQKISILEPIDLEVRSGEIVALLGPSGSGKSTLMRMIAGLIPPTDGQVLYHNRPLVGLNPGVAIVFQNFALYPWLTVLENVELGLKAKGELPEPRRQKALRMIDVIGLDGFENAYPKELSGGMRQRVSVARALAMQPEILLLDEPLSALDALTRANLQDEINRICQEEKKTVILITNDPDEAILLADRVIPLTAGPRATLGPSIPVTIPRPRQRAAVNSNYDFKQTRAEVVDYLLKATDKRKAAMSMKLVLPDLIPEDLDAPRHPFGQKRRPRRRSEEKRETVEVMG